MLCFLLSVYSISEELYDYLSLFRQNVINHCNECFDNFLPLLDRSPFLHKLENSSLNVPLI